MTETENTDGAISTLSYTKATRTFLAISAGNRRETATLDAKDRLTSLTEGLGRTPKVFTYDSSGRLEDMTQGSLGQTYTWDARDRLATSSDDAGRTSPTPDGADRTTTVTDGEEAYTASPMTVRTRSPASSSPPAPPTPSASTASATSPGTPRPTARHRRPRATRRAR